jgi:DNA-damage-inducible protein J
MATKSAFIRARTEPALKADAEAILDSLGLTATSVINMLYKQIVKRRAVPFDVAEPEPARLHGAADSPRAHRLRRTKSVGTGLGSDRK